MKKSEIIETFTCSYQEWAFAQAFNTMQGMTKSKQQNKKSLIEWGILAILFFVSIIVSNIHHVFGWLSYTVIAYGIFRFIRYGLANGKQKSSIVRKQKGDTLQYIKVDDDGMYINVSNNDDKNSMMFISWTNVEQIDFYYTRSPYHGNTRLIALHNALTQHKDWITHLIDTFNYSEKRYFSLYFYHGLSQGANSSMYQLQLPSSWLKNNTFRSLVEQVKNYSSIEIKPFDFSRANVGPFKSESFETENQTYLNTVYKNALQIVR